MSFLSTFMQRLVGHTLVDDKFNDILDTNKKVKNNKLIKPPTPKDENTTSIGDYFKQNGAVKVDNYFTNLNLYFRNDSANMYQIQAIRRCRQIALYPELDDAIDETVNEILVNDPENPAYLKVDYLDADVFAKSLKEAIEEEAKYILKLLQFRKNAYSIVKRFLIDGCLYFEKVFDTNYIQRGVIDLNILDSTCMSFVQEYETDQQTKVRKMTDEYFIFSYNSKETVKPDVNPFVVMTVSNFQSDFVLPKVLVAYTDSGMYHPDYMYPLSYLHRSIKIANQLRLLEDAILVYRITRAPERRVFYVDVANLPPAQAEEFIQELMKQYKTEKSYDVSTGTMTSGAAVLNVLEDFWMPRRNGVNSTQVETLPGAQNLGEIRDLDYFNEKLWRSLGVPFTRRIAGGSGGVNFGYNAAITVDEVKFHKSVNNKRRRFEEAITDILMTQLILKRIINSEDSDEIESNIKWVWNEDNYFYDSLNLEIRNSQFDLISKIDEKVSAHISLPWVSKTILKFTDDEIRQFAAERKNPEEYGFEKAKKAAPAEDGGFGGGGGGFGAAPAAGGFGMPTAELGVAEGEETFGETTPEGTEAPIEGEAAPEAEGTETIAQPIESSF